jgi:hypothetical protein
MARSPGKLGWATSSDGASGSPAACADCNGKAARIKTDMIVNTKTLYKYLFIFISLDSQFV